MSFDDVNVRGKWKGNFIDADFFERTRPFSSLSDTTAGDQIDHFGWNGPNLNSLRPDFNHFLLIDFFTKDRPHHVLRQWERVENGQKKSLVLIFSNERALVSF